MWAFINFAITTWLLIRFPVSVNADNERPIIGILVCDEDELQSYVAASYVKFVEGSGGRAAPIFINQPRSYYENLLNCLNGVLLPGGSAVLRKPKGYGVAAKHIYEISMELNDNGIYFPLWGTCLGFQALLYFSNNDTEFRVKCESDGQSLPLEFVKDYRTSRMFKNIPVDIINILENENVTANFHNYCATTKFVSTMKFNRTWKILSVNHDWNGLEFVSTIEHVKYPFYGVQFHPEKNLYEWQNRKISHTANAVLSSQYFANFLLSEARKNTNKFPNSTIEREMLFYNYEAVPEPDPFFTQCYIFLNDDIDDLARLGKNLRNIKL